MQEGRFTENFEKITQTSYYVSVCRSNDVSKFNFKSNESDIAKTSVDISEQVGFIEIENSVDQSFRIGRISIRDNLDLRSTIPLIGNEILYIEYNSVHENSYSSTLNKKGFFRVMSLENTTDSQLRSTHLNFTDRELIFTIAEYPYVDLLTYNSSNKTYEWDGGTEATAPKGAGSIETLVSKMFTDPLSKEVIATMGIEYKGIKTADQNPEDWLNYYSPNWSKLKNINFLKRFATSLEGNRSYYFLNCEGSRIVFKSIYQEFLDNSNKDSNSIDLVTLDHMGLSESNISPDCIANTLMDVKYKLGNGLSGLFNGFSGNTLFSFDYLSGHVFSVNDYRTFRKTANLGSNSFYINYQKYGNGHSSMGYSPFPNPKMNENLKKYEYSKKSFNSMICEATAFITNSRYLGQTVDLSTPAASNLTKRSLDKVYGRGWCIWGYKDIIAGGRGICKITLKKDSTGVEYDGIFGSMMTV